MYKFLILLLFAFTSCINNKKEIEVGFYDWQYNNSFENQKNNDSTLKILSPKNLYFKLLDIDWDENYQYYPTAIKDFNYFNNYSDTLLKNINFVFCIYITNKVFEKIDSNKIEDFANKVYLKTLQITDTTRFYNRNNSRFLNRNVSSFKEFQVDCDWTEKTRDKYFHFLNKIKIKFNKINVTSTLRLHQFKYRTKMGIPPVSEVYLMCYNVGKARYFEDNNSIYSEKVAKEYFNLKEKYPLKVNIALPLFNWALIFKNNKFESIINDFDASFLKTNYCIKTPKTNIYIIAKDTTISNIFLVQGDILKFENVNNDDLMSAATLCKKVINNESSKLVFFDIKHSLDYNNETYEKVLNLFNN